MNINCFIKSIPTILFAGPDLHIASHFCEKASIPSSVFPIDRLRSIYQKRFPNKNSYTIENGIDLEVLNSAKLRPNLLNKNIFTIIYTGILYEGHNPVLFTNSYNKILENLSKIDKKRIQCVFIGITHQSNKNTAHIIQMVKCRPQNYKLIQRVSHKEALTYQANAQILLKFSMDSQQRMGLGAKLSEYAATKNPVLTVMSVNNKETPFFPNRNIQVLCVNELEIETFILEHFNSWKQGVPIKTDISETEIYKMSRRYQTEQLASIIKEHFS